MFRYKTGTTLSLLSDKFCVGDEPTDAEVLSKGYCIVFRVDGDNNGTCFRPEHVISGTMIQVDEKNVKTISCHKGYTVRLMKDKIQFITETDLILLTGDKQPRKRNGSKVLDVLFRDENRILKVAYIPRTETYVFMDQCVIEGKFESCTICTKQGYRNFTARPGCQGPAPWIADVIEEHIRETGPSILRKVQNWVEPSPEETAHCDAAAERGDIEELERLRREGYKWGIRTCVAAVRGEQLRALIWLRAHDCPWDSSVACEAHRVGSLQVLRWFKTQNCEWRGQ